MNVIRELERRPKAFLLLRRLGLVFALLLSAGAVQHARAQAMIFYQATDLADITPGQDLWRYHYSVTGFNFQAGQGFSVFFAPLDAAQLQNPPPAVNAGWDVLAVQPDLILRDPGYYDAQARQDAPSLADPFTITFVWLSGGTPGAQPFTIYNTDFSTLISGQTIVVPEPASAVLLGAGLVVLAFAARRNRQ